MSSLARAERVKKAADIDRLFTNGVRATFGRVTVLALPNCLGHPRLAVIAGKRLGKAVQRNRMRRRLRAAWRSGRVKIPALSGYDLAILARPGVLEATWTDIVRDVTMAVTKVMAKASPPTSPLHPPT
ncbi:MAG: ribonuclease P protein component [Planctomycetota bacterium]|jgi:ribonuclease P protein component|nr:ribonuclease P protein component [Planctomycetota bacterium]